MPWERLPRSSPTAALPVFRSTSVPCRASIFRIRRCSNTKAACCVFRRRRARAKWLCMNCSAFPISGSKLPRCCDCMIVDATLFRHGELWWLAGASDPGGAHLGADLHLWHATDILGPWTPHAANPVKTDVGSARPAGRPFVSEGVLYRPAQDSSQTYGFASCYQSRPDSDTDDVPRGAGCIRGAGCRWSVSRWATYAVCSWRRDARRWKASRVFGCGVSGEFCGA